MISWKMHKNICCAGKKWPHTRLTQDPPAWLQVPCSSCLREGQSQVHPARQLTHETLIALNRIPQTAYIFCNHSRSLRSCSCENILLWELDPLIVRYESAIRLHDSVDSSVHCKRWVLEISVLKVNVAIGREMGWGQGVWALPLWKQGDWVPSCYCTVLMRYYWHIVTLEN